MALMDRVSLSISMLQSSFIPSNRFKKCCFITFCYLIELPAGSRFVTYESNAGLSLIKYDIQREMYIVAFRQSRSSTQETFQGNEKHPSDSINNLFVTMLPTCKGERSLRSCEINHN